MAAPKRNRSKKTDPLYQQTRDKIQISQLTTRLENNALGKLTNPNGDEIEMTTGQIASAKLLLDKSMPNLQSTEMSGPNGKPLDTAMKVTFVNPKK